MLKQLIYQLGQELAIEDQIITIEDYHYLLPLETHIEVEAKELAKSYLLKGHIADCPQKHTATFLLEVMEANLFGLGTRGASIGLNDEGKVLTLSLELDRITSFKDFKEKLEDFISVLNFWRKEALKHE